MVSPNPYVSDTEEVPPSDVLSNEEPKAKRTRRSRKPNAKAIADTFGAALEFANIGITSWAGIDHAKQVWIFSEQEIEQEAEALATLILAYPRLARYMAMTEQAGPLMQFAFVQYLIFGRKFAIYKRMTMASELDNANVQSVA